MYEWRAVNNKGTKNKLMKAGNEMKKYLTSGPRCKGKGWPRGDIYMELKKLVVTRDDLLCTLQKYLHLLQLLLRR